MPTELEKFQAEEIERLKKENAALVSENKKLNSAAQGEPCPFCRKNGGELIKITPSPIEDFAVMGVKQGYYHCSNCGKDYDREMS